MIQYYSCRFYANALLTIMIGWLFSTPLRAAHDHFTRIALQAGLPSTLTCIFADSKGYVWTGTRAGLGRFDGHEQYRYTFEERNIHSLPGDYIYQITTDPQQTLWVMTDQGVARYDYNHNHFHRLLDQEGHPVAAFAACCYQNSMLFVSGKAIYQLELGEERATKWYDLTTSEELRIVKLCLLSNHTMLIGSRWNGVFSINLQNGQMKQAPYDCGLEITDMLIDRQKRLWIATYNEGVRCFRTTGQLIRSYHTGNADLSHNIVLCLEQRQGMIWMGTDGGGINILNPESNHFSHIKHRAGEKQYTLPTNSINCLHNDAYGNLWIGGVYNGLIGLSRVAMRTYTDVHPGSHHGLSHPVVLSLYQQTGSRKLYIGTDGGGMNSFNPDTGTFDSYATTAGMKIASICGYDSEQLMISVFSEGLYRFNLRTGSLQPFTLLDEATTNRLCKHGHAVNLIQNSPRTVLFLADHVYIYHLDEQRFSIAHEEKPIYWGNLQAIATTQRYTFLCDTRRVYRLDNETEKLAAIFTCRNDQSITSATRDDEGHIWLGTNRGLMCFNPADGSIEQLPTELYNEISAISCDLEGRLWIGADNNLFSYLPKEKRFILYGESDGVLPNEYRSKSKWTSPDGDIFMGGVQGLLHIGTDLPSVQPDTPILQLSDVLCNGESNGDISANPHHELSIPHATHVGIRFMAREKDIFRQRLYRYHVEGLFQEEVITRQPTITLRALPQGTYHILASCNTKEGTWAPYTQLLTLHVLPPWYATWWFVLGCALIGTLLILIVAWRAVRHKEQKMRWAMKEHEQQVYEEKVRFLINLSHELRTPLTLIYAPLKRLLQQMQSNEPHYQPLQAIYRQSQRMKELINTVLDLRKMEVGESQLILQPHPLNQWVKQVAQDFVGEAAANDIQIQFALDPRIDKVSYDKEKAEIILTNLLMNALKHSPKESVITLRTELSDDAQWVRIAVSDQGEGLSHLDNNKLFTRFYQGEGETQGTGIGLSFAKILVDQHQGIMGAINNPDQGATFYFEIPLTQITEKRLCSPRPYLNELLADDHSEATLEDDAFDTTPYTLLVADDNNDLTAFLKEALTPFFKKIILATDGQQAIQLTHSHHPDILISDVMMPRINGYQLCQKLKGDLETSHIPIILLTAKSDSQSMASGYKTGADGYLSKPFELDMLLAVMKSRLKNREQVRRRYLASGSLPIPEENTFSLVDENFLLKLNEVIQQNLSESTLDVKLLCHELAMSRASLYNKIKVITGMSANEYINKLRMEKAMQLIRTSKLSFTEVAEQVGFASPSYFSTAFKQYTGFTPTQFKRTHSSSSANQSIAGSDGASQ